MQSAWLRLRDAVQDINSALLSDGASENEDFENSAVDCIDSEHASEGYSEVLKGQNTQESVSSPTLPPVDFYPLTSNNPEFNGDSLEKSNSDEQLLEVLNFLVTAGTQKILGSQTVSEKSRTIESSAGEPFFEKDQLKKIPENYKTSLRHLIENRKRIVNFQEIHEQLLKRVACLEQEKKNALDVINSLQNAKNVAGAELAERKREVKDNNGREPEETHSSLEVSLLRNLVQELSQANENLKNELNMVNEERNTLFQYQEGAKKTIKDLELTIEQLQIRNDTNWYRFQSDIAAFKSELMVLNADREASAKLQDDVLAASEKVKIQEEVITKLQTALKSCESEKKILSESVETLLRRLYKQKEDEQNYVDKRIITEIIKQLSKASNQSNRKDEIIMILCDVIGLGDEEKEHIGIINKRFSLPTKTLSDQFVDFLDSETRPVQNLPAAHVIGENAQQ